MRLLLGWKANKATSTPATGEEERTTRLAIEGSKEEHTGSGTAMHGSWERQIWWSTSAR
jgi:hypothetical protein